MILLTSGLTITYTHQGLVGQKFGQTLIGFLETLFWAICFTLFQLKEYIEAPFAISDGIYGSLFYMITGLHGFHVIVGTIFIAVCGIRCFFNHFSKNHHVGFELSTWYWHFVDAVWLFVYLVIYVWGGYNPQI